MAVLRLTMTYQRLFKLVKPFVQNALPSLCFSRISSYSFPLCRPICTESEMYRDYGSDQFNLAHKLISIFTRQPFSPNDPELKELAPRLSTKVVETVLNGFKRWGLAYMFFKWASNQMGYRNDIYTYNAMASILSRARQNAPLRALTADVVNSRCTMSPGALGFLIRCLGGAGLVEEANTLFDRVKMIGLCIPNVYSYNCLLEAISKSHSASIELVEMRLQEMRDCGHQFDKYTLTPVLKVCCNLGKFDKALDVFSVIHDEGWVDEHVLTILVVSFCKWGEVDKAFGLVERMEECNVRLNYKTLCVLIHGFVKQFRVDNALQFLNKMRQSGFVPDVGLYDVMIGGYCKHKQLEKALSLCSDMKRLGINPDSGIMGKLISSFSEEGELIRVLEEIREDIDSKSLVLLYKSALEGFIQNHLVEKAHDFLRALMSNDAKGFLIIDELLDIHKKLPPPDVNSFTTVINGLLEAKKLDVALGLLQDMVRSGCKPNLLIYNNIIERLCKEGRLEESCKILVDMKELGVLPSQFTLNAIFGGFCRREDVDGAVDMVRKMRFYGFEPWIKHSTLLVKKLCKNGRAFESCRYLEILVQEGFLAHIVAYTAAIDGLVKVKEIDKAAMLFKDICARGYCPDVIAYNVLIKGLCKANRVAEGTELFNEMVQNGLTPSVVTYNSLIDGWCNDGNVQSAITCLSRMFENDTEPDVITYTILVNGLCAAGRPDDAIILWNEMKRKDRSPSRITFMALIQGLCRCSMPGVALPYFLQMKDNGMEPDTSVYATLISTFISSSDLPFAFEIFKELVSKSGFPDSANKNSLILRDALITFLEDARTSSCVTNLIAEGQVPAINSLP